MDTTTSAVSIAIVYFQSKLYAIGLLYSLNVRKSLQGMGSRQINDTSSHDDFWSPHVTTTHVRAEPEVFEMGNVGRRSDRRVEMGPTHCV